MALQARRLILPGWLLMAPGAHAWRLCSVVFDLARAWLVTRGLGSAVRRTGNRRRLISQQMFISKLHDVPLSFRGHLATLREPPDSIGRLVIDSDPHSQVEKPFALRLGKPGSNPVLVREISLEESNIFLNLIGSERRIRSRLC